MELSASFQSLKIDGGRADVGRPLGRLETNSGRGLLAVLPIQVPAQPTQLRARRLFPQQLSLLLPCHEGCLAHFLRGSDSLGGDGVVR